MKKKKKTVKVNTDGGGKTITHYLLLGPEYSSGIQKMPPLKDNQEKEE